MFHKDRTVCDRGWWCHDIISLYHKLMMVSWHLDNITLHKLVNFMDAISDLYFNVNGKCFKIKILF